METAFRSKNEKGDLWMDLHTVHHKLSESPLIKGSEGYGYKYLNLPDLLSAVSPVLLASGFLRPFHTARSVDHGTIITTRVQHTCGDYLEVDCSVMNAGDYSPQKVGSCETYGRRYGILMALGVTSVDDDDDGVAAKPKQREQQQASQRRRNYG